MPGKYSSLVLRGLNSWEGATRVRFCPHPLPVSTFFIVCFRRRVWKLGVGGEELERSAEVGRTFLFEVSVIISLGHTKV